MLTLYSMPSSGNSYKVRLLLALLGRPYHHIPCESQSPELQTAKTEGKLPLGKVPALHLETGEVLSESNAILWYLASGTSWIPNDPLDQARMLSWMFFEQNRHEPVIAVRASLRSYPHLADEATPELLEELLVSGNSILDLMEHGLQGQDWFAGDTPTIADIALYSYTHTAEDRGGFDLSPFSAIRDWLNRTGALPGFEPLTGPAHG
ncbi:glutathione S-transferase family protein [Aliiroseovarius sp. F47248L]|uniref:glutathione S-transferase family protein n=1 Tax=Aliiroseovarius sp. F47248L TaxID=2926420 RepID=UPI001FF2856A|nr:glutathione S-transferase family protein [Aliiroseovarius sp. F47248L]MCK0140437.1 glutathione S-transferase family protein [Aliiroseovarius sp. F47248L]